MKKISPFYIASYCKMIDKTSWTFIINIRLSYLLERPQKKFYTFRTFRRRRISVHELEEGATEAGRCHNKNLIFKVFSSSRWYYILTLGFLIKTVLIKLLVLYIVRRRAREKGSMNRGGMLDRIISPQGKGYSPVSADMSSKIPVGCVKMFRDDESEEEEEVGRGFMTPSPYSDNPKDKPYRDDERA